MTRFLPLVALLAACTPLTEDDAGARLDLFTAADPDSPYDGRTLDGTTAVTGQSEDWTLAITAADTTTTTITVHTPGASDLSGLNGQDLSVQTGSAWNSDERDVQIDDADGPSYLAQVSAYGVATERFGQDFVAYGEDLGTGTLTDDYGDYTVSWHNLDFTTDNGVVTAEVGVPFEATVAGDRWRIVVHAAFEVTEYPDTMPGCGGGISSALSFEMLRVATDVDTTPLPSVDDISLVSHAECGG